VTKLKIAVLGSTRGTDMQAIIDAIEAGQLDASIEVVVSNKEDAGILERARKHGIEALFLNPKEFESREKYDGKLVEALRGKDVELVLLIGYMKIITKPLVDAFRNRIMNIHPSLLPAFAGGMDKNVHQLVLDAGVKVSGCTLHFVTEEVDSGPIIAQKCVPIAENETVDSLKEKVQRTEGEVIVEAVRKFAEGKIKVEGNKVRILE